MARLLLILALVFNPLAWQGAAFAAQRDCGDSAAACCCCCGPDACECCISPSDSQPKPQEPAPAPTRAPDLSLPPSHPRAALARPDADDGSALRYEAGRWIAALVPALERLCIWRT